MDIEINDYEILDSFYNAKRAKTKCAIEHQTVGEIISIKKSGALLHLFPSGFSLLQIAIRSGWTVVRGLSDSFTSNGALNMLQESVF